MKPKQRMLKKSLSFDEYDEIINPPPSVVDFERILDKALSRRGFLGAASVMTVGTSAFISSSGLLTVADASAGQGGFNGIDFSEVAANTLDTVTVPEGYHWHVVSRWGDPLWSEGVDFDHESRGTAQSQLLSIGDNNDGMDVFDVDGRTILVTNNEYTTLEVFYGNNESQRPENEDDIRKGQAATGVSIYEIEKNDGTWKIVKDSEYNRRIHSETVMDITGPARGHALLKTAADPEGMQVLGTYNNCGNGRTPWGTFLTCEENFNGYYSSDDETRLTPEHKRYGIGAEDRGYGWGAVDKRFKIDVEPNEVNRAGYVVEIDPSDPGSRPRKLTALGRFKHENAELVIASDGRLVVYLGDDERGEFLYKYVSDGKFTEGSADNPSLLENGTLYVARFSDDGRGQWIPLTPETTEMEEAQIFVFTRLAGSRVGATTMDRPEWVAVNPAAAEGYCCLTNNKNRGVKPNKGGDDTSVNGPNPREKNNYGQIVKWMPDDGNHSAEGFSWTLYVLAGNPTVHEGTPYAGSENINAGNMFNSPDGLRFDSRGNLWIQTDGKYSNKDDFAGMGNNQMLVGNPQTGEIRRFLVGPREAEITGITWSKDKTTAFVGIQHPGEEGDSSFPDGDGKLARSCVIAIASDDGSEIG